MANISSFSKTKALFRPIGILTLGSLFYVYGFTLRIMPSAMTQELMSGFKIKAQMLGVLVGLMYWGYTLMQIPSGLLFDRFNARYLLTTTVLICSFGTFMLGSSTSITVACMGTFIMGLGEAFGFVGVLVLASRWFPPKYFAFIVGIVQLMGAAGAIIGEGPIAALVNRIGWQNTILWMAAFGILLAISIWTFVRDNPNYAQELHTQPKKTEFQRLHTVLKKSQNWWVALYSFAIWAPVLIMAGLWVVPYLMALYKTSNTIAALAASWIWVGIGVGSPLFGWWSDKISRRCLPLSVSALLSLFPALMIIYGPHVSWPIMYFMLFIFGVGASGQALSFGLVQDNNHPSVGGTAVGLNNMAVVFGGVILQPLVGFLLHLNWDHKIVNNVPVYSVVAYKEALISVPICAALAFIISAFFIKETHCKPQYNVPYK